ncbi:hypothetical protein SBDP1_1590005 [Syntrophobacter sp. SbD1]|nr:hypothetical protein SBDP1_1590005 [Syntrophobacter sp. SbD1]
MRRSGPASDGTARRSAHADWRCRLCETNIGFLESCQDCCLSYCFLSVFCVLCGESLLDFLACGLAASVPSVLRGEQYLAHGVRVNEPTEYIKEIFKNLEKKLCQTFYFTQAAGYIISWEENIFPPPEKIRWLPLLPLGLLFFCTAKAVIRNRNALQI